jgi:peroxiredoxin
METDIQQLLDRALTELRPPNDLAHAAITGHVRRKHRRRIASGVVAVVTVAAALTVWVTTIGHDDGQATITPVAPPSSSAELIPSSQRQPAPALSGTTIQGKQLKVNFLQSQRSAGRPAITVVAFGGSWCAPCRSSSSAFESAYDGWNSPVADNGVGVVGVAERDTVTNALAAAKKARVDYPVIFDSDQTLARSWHPKDAPPYTVIVDSDGLIAARLTGAVTTAELHRLVDALRSQQAGGPYGTGIFAAGVKGASAKGRTVTLEWANARCDDLPTLQAELVEVRVRESVRAIHVEVLARPNPADIVNEKANHTYGCLGTGVHSQVTITLAAPIGSRGIIDDSGGGAVPLSTSH